MFETTNQYVMLIYVHEEKQHLILNHQIRTAVVFRNLRSCVQKLTFGNVTWKTYIRKLMKLYRFRKLFSQKTLLASTRKRLNFEAVFFRRVVSWETICSGTDITRIRSFFLKLMKLCVWKLMGQTALRELAVKKLFYKNLGTSIGKQVMEGIFPTPHSDYGDLSQNPTSHFQVLWRILAHLGPSWPSNSYVPLSKL